MKLKHLLFALAIFITPHHVAANPGGNHDVVQLSRQHKQSRDAAVKIVTDGGHGTGTYVKVGESIFGGGYLGVLTAAHVVEGKELVVVETDSYQTVAKVVWKSVDDDLAFLITGKIENRKHLTVEASPKISAGDKIVYSGYPSTHEILTFSCSVASPSQNGMLVAQGYAWFGASGSGFVNQKGKVFAVLSGVTVENFFGFPQVQETIIFASIIKKEQIREIIAAIESLPQPAN